MVQFLNRIKSFIRENPILSIGVGFIVLFIVTIIIMRIKNRQATLDRLRVQKPDVMSLSYLGIASLPLGIRNNNPGNLRRYDGNRWLGKITSNKTGFEQFEAFVYGLRAMIIDIRGDILKDGDNTIRKLISAYAPPNENNTSSYISNTSQRTGIGPDQILTGSKEEMRKLIKSMVISEHGPSSAHGKPEWVSDAMFDAAWELSLV